MHWVEELRTTLGMSQGELLQFARGLFEDGALVSVSHLKQSQRYRLIQQLEEMQHQREELDKLSQLAVA